MKKVRLSLKRIVERSMSQDEIDNFSDEIEGMPTARAQEAMPNWPEVGVRDRYPEEGPKEGEHLDFVDFLKDFNLNAMEFANWKKAASSQGMTPELYKKIVSKVGDFENFLAELSAVDRSLSEPFYNNLSNASAGASPTPTKYEGTKEPQIPWSELARRGDEIGPQTKHTVSTNNKVKAPGMGRSGTQTDLDVVRSPLRHIRK